MQSTSITGRPLRQLGIIGLFASTLTVWFGMAAASVTVSIDIDPGSSVNFIDRSSIGNETVAMFGSSTLDVVTVDASTVQFAGAPAISSTILDLNNDAFLDALFQFSIPALNLPDGTTQACLTGATYDATAFAGCDAVTLQAPVVTPQEQIAALTEAVQALVTGGVLLPAQGNSLETKLGAALDLLARGNTQGAISKLNDVVKQVSTLIKTGKLTSAQGQPLIDAVLALTAQLQNSSSLAVQAVTATGSSLPGASVVASLRQYPATADAVRGSIALRFELPVAADVTLEFYDLAGRRIDEVRMGSLGPGQHEWSWAPPNLAIGLFFYRLRAGVLMASGRVALVK